MILCSLVLSVGHARDDDGEVLPASSSPALRFEHLTPEDGLSSGRTWDIIQDDQGFIWIATSDGLNRYDGYEVKVYRHHPDDPHSLSHNVVRVVYEDSQGIIWTGGHEGGGLNRFDRDSERFTHYRHDPDDPLSLSDDRVNAIYQDRSGTLWMGTLGGLNRFNQQDGTFTRYQYDPDDPVSLSANYVQSLYEDRAGRLWVSTQGGGINILDRSSGTFTRYRHDPDDPGSLSDDLVLDIKEDRSGTLWVASIGGLDQFDPASNSFVHYRHDPDDPASLSTNGVFAIHEDKHSGDLWLGSDSGLIHFDRTGERFTNYRRDPTDPYSLGGDFIWRLYGDRAGALWITHFGEGVSKLDQGQFQFDHILAGYSVTGIVESAPGVLWASTNEQGLLRLERSTGRVTEFRHDPGEPNSLGSDMLNTLSRDDSGNLWMGTLYDGLNRLDPTTLQYTHYLPHPDSDLTNVQNVWAIHRDRADNLWIGTWAELTRMNLVTGQRTHYRHDPNKDLRVNVIREDPAGIIWIGTDDGLDRFDPASETFRYFRHDPANPDSLSDNMVNAIHFSPSGAIWLGTNGGLNRFEPDTAIFSHYRESDGLANDTVTGILEDGQGDLWVTTGNGLSRFNPDNETFRNYSTHDGLESKRAAVVYRNSAGEFFLGGTNGINIFRPGQITDNPYVPPVVLTDFQLFNESVPIATEGSPLSRAINRTRELSLAYDQSIFSIGFAALNYRASGKNRYAYILEGFEQEWNYVDSRRRFATYTNLDPGSYIFRVKAANNDGLWNEEGAALAITIIPPWWQTTWFRVLAAVLVIGAVAGAFIGEYRSAEHRRRSLEAQVAERTRELSEINTRLERAKSEAESAKQKAEAASEAKNRFLATMSHELRTPLNSILGFAQILQQQNIDAETTKRLAMIRQSGQHLLTLINDILDMSKIEARRLELYPQPVHLPTFLDTIADIIRDRAEAKDLVLLCETDSRLPIGIEVDETRLRQVLINLLDNAVKFTDSGEVRLRVQCLDTPTGTAHPKPRSTLHFEVSDTGIGIESRELARLFKSFEQVGDVSRRAQGTGLGLSISRELVRLMGSEMHVESTPGEGSRFWFDVVLPVTRAVASDDQAPQRLIKGYQGPRLQVLVVDDIASNRTVLVDMLTPPGFVTLEAEDGRQALELAQTHRPDLILMDRRMPVMDGLDAIRRLRQLPGLQKTPVICVSASVSKEDQIEIIRAGCDAFLPKPIRWTSLVTELEKHLPIQWQYEDMDDAPAEDTEIDIVLPPRADLAALNELVQRGQITRIEAWAEQLAGRDPRYRALAGQMGQLAREFKITRITRLTRKYLAQINNH